jgi:transcriptional regulator with XRE-family HTH domain
MSDTTGPQFAALVARTGWSMRAIATRFGIGKSSMADMAAGRISPDPAIVAYLARVADAIDRIPMPELVDRRVVTRRRAPRG